MNLHEEIKEYINILSRGDYCKPCAQGGRGIVMCVGGEALYIQALINIKYIREKSNLPIEIYYADSKELSPQAIRYMENLYDGLKFLNMEELIANSVLEPLFMNPYKVANFRGFQIKNAAIYHSSFDEILFIDCDIIPSIKCDEYFEISFYKENGYLLFPDFWSYDQKKMGLNSNEILTAGLLLTYYGIDPSDGVALEIESGLVVLNKKMTARAIGILYFINTHGKYFYKFFYGEKESYKVALHSIGKKVLFPMRPPVPFGMKRNDVFYGDGMLHFLPVVDGKSYSSHYHFTINTIPMLLNSWNKDFYISIPNSNEYSYRFVRDSLGLVRMVGFGVFNFQKSGVVNGILRNSIEIIKKFKESDVVVEVP
jgi:alpha 1,2-mannosyltransferase